MRRSAGGRSQDRRSRHRDRDREEPPPEEGGRLTVVATPIGNLGDLSPRAAEALAGADRICCEDTRRARALLSAAGLPAGGDRLVSLHAHNEEARIPLVLRWLQQGRRVALVSDAGTPGLSDPGGRLVSATVEAGIPVTAVPGPSAVLAALAVSGLRTDRFCVEGFLPRRGSARRRRLEALRAEERTAVVFEAPARLAATLAELAAVLESAGGRRVALARELTKLHEEVWRGTLSEAAEAFAGRPVRGEVVIVLEGAAPEPEQTDRARLQAALRSRLTAGETPSAAASGAAAEVGTTRREAYQAALDLRRTGAADQPDGPDGEEDPG